jgi:hypothetical protein
MENTELLKIEGLILPKFIEKKKKRKKAKDPKGLIRIDKKTMSRADIREAKQINEIRRYEATIKKEQEVVEKKFSIIKKNAEIVKEFRRDTELGLTDYMGFKEGMFQYLISRLIQAYNGGLTVEQKLSKLDPIKVWIKSRLIKANPKDGGLVVEVVEDHEAVKDDEIPLKKGQKITVTEQDLSGWWYGKIQGTETEGWFPVNFTTGKEIWEKEKKEGEKVTKELEVLEEEVEIEIEKKKEEFFEQAREAEEKEKKVTEKEIKLRKKAAIFDFRTNLNKRIEEINKTIDEVESILRKKQDQLYDFFYKSFDGLYSSQEGESREPKDFERSCLFATVLTRIFFGKSKKRPGTLFEDSKNYRNISLSHVMRSIWYTLNMLKKKKELRGRKIIQEALDKAYNRELWITKEFRDLLDKYRERVKRYTSIYEKEYDGYVHFNNIWDFERIIERQAERTGESKVSEEADMKAKVRGVKKNLKKTKKKKNKNEMYNDRFYLRKKLRDASSIFENGTRDGKEKGVKQFLMENYFVPMFV